MKHISAILDCAIQNVMIMPTQQTYGELQRAYTHYNNVLFDGALPDCLITLQREKRTYGYFSSRRFIHREGERLTDEIAINPSFFAVIPMREILQTIVHEMVHLWQYHHGDPGRRGYHNKEWGDKMESIGLMPSHTGQPGGKKTGERMGDYAIEGGRFLEASEQLLATGFKLDWLDRFPPPEAIAAGMRSTQKPEGLLAEALAAAAGERGQVGQAKVNKTNRIKQQCPGCGAQAWGKPGLSLLCGERSCKKSAFEAVE